MLEVVTATVQVVRYGYLLEFQWADQNTGSSAFMLSYLGTDNYIASMPQGKERMDGSGPRDTISNRGSQTLDFLMMVI